MKLLYYELKKYACNRFVVWMACILLALNAGFLLLWLAPYDEIPHDLLLSFYDQYYENPEKVTDNYKAWKQIKENNDRIREEAIKSGNHDYILERYQNIYSNDENYPDSYYYNELFSEIEKIQTYPEVLDNIVHTAEKNIRAYQYMGVSDDSYVIRYQKKTIDAYTSLSENIRMGLEYVHGWNLYFDYGITNVLIFICILCMAVFSFSQEDSSGMHSLIYSSKKGRRKTASAKISAVIIMAVGTAILFSLETFAVIGLKIGYSNPSNAIQLVDTFFLSPYAITVGEYFLLSLLFKMITSVLFASLILIGSLVFRHAAITYVLGAVLYGINLLLVYSNPDNPSSVVKRMNLIAAMETSPVFEKYISVNLFGNAVDAAYVLPIMFVCITLFAFVGSIFLYIWNKQFIRIPKVNICIASFLPKCRTSRADRRILGSFRQKNLLSWEIRKLFHSGILVGAVILLVIAKIWISVDVRDPLTPSELIYRTYMQSLAGEVTSEKRAYIESERTEINTVLLAYDKMQEDYASDIISYEQYADFLETYNDAYQKNEPLSRVEDHLLHIDRLAEKGKTAWFVYESGWETLFFPEFDVPMFLILLILLTGFITMEFDAKSSAGSFSNILRSTGNGRSRTFHLKLLCGFLLAVIISVAFYTLDILTVLHAYEIGQPDAPIHSMELLEMVPFSFTIFGYSLLFFAIRLFTNVLLASIIMAAAFIFKKYVASLTAVTAITLMPYLFSRFGLPIFSRIDFTLLTQGSPTLIWDHGGYCYIACLLLIGSFMTLYARRLWIK